MEKFKEFEKNTLITLLAFIIPALIMLLIFIIGNFAPFGNVSVLVADMRYQFVDYIGYMKSVFFGNNDMFYTFSKTFGGDMMGFASYYLFNPFFLILLPFPNDMLPVGIVIMLIITSGFMGLNFHLMLRAIWGNRFSSVIFSTAYAMMGFNMAYINCPKCGKELRWIRFHSPSWTWVHECGRGGPLAICEDCHKQVYFRCEVMN